MAITEVSSNRGSIAVVTAGFDEPIAMAAGGSITVGNFLILTAVMDNSGTLGVDPNMFIASSSSVNATPYYDLRGNLWTLVKRTVRNTGGVANDGCVIDTWISRTTFAYTNGDSITLQWSFTQASVVARIAEYSGMRPITYSIVTPASSVGNGTSIGPVATITPSLTGQMVLGVAGVEDTTAITGDADSTDGTWTTVANNTVGAGATGLSLFTQRKIVSGVTAQDWKVTKTGAADWAAHLVVFDTFTSVANAFASGNPHAPCIAGPEILPLDSTALPVDTGTEYLFTHQVFQNDWLSQQYGVAATVPPDSTVSSPIQQHTYAYDVYQAGDELAVDPIEKVRLFVGAAGVGGGATVSDAGTAADALARVGGGHIVMTTNQYVDVLFDPVLLTTYYPNHRIVRWGLRFFAWRDDGVTDSTPSEGMIFEWRDSAASGGAGGQVGVAGYLVPNFQRDAQYQTRWLGENNQVIRGKGIIVNSQLAWGASWTVNDLSHMTVADQTTRMRIYGQAGLDPSQTTVYLDYVEAIVELVPERRLASGTRRITSAPAYAGATGSPDLYPTGSAITPVWTALNTNTRWTVPAAANTYVLAVREASPSSPSDLFVGQTVDANRTIGANESIGPSYRLSSVVQHRATLENDAMTGQPVLRRAQLSDSVLPTADSVQEYDQYHIAATALDMSNYPLEGTFWPDYAVDSFGNTPQVYTGASKTQYIVTDGVQAFTRIKLLVQPDELTTAGLTISVEQPLATPIATATISVAQALAAPDRGSGWREVSVALSGSITPTAGRVAVVVGSTTTVAAPWYFANAASDVLGGTYDTGAPNAATQLWDYAVVLQCALAVPTYSLGNATSNLYRPSDRCLAASVTVPTITLTNGATFDHLVIERSLDAGVTWDPITILDDPTNSQVYTDYEVPWDITISTITYRLTGYRNADRLSSTVTTTAWGAVATAPGLAFGLASSTGLHAFTITTEGDMQVEYNPLNPITIVALHGIDYQVALRASEERGLQVTVPVLVDNLACGEAATAFRPDSWTVSAGGEAMTPSPFDQIRSLEGTRLTLLLPGGHARYVTLDLGGMTARTASGTYLAELTLTDATLPGVDPFV